MYHADTTASHHYATPLLLNIIILQKLCQVGHGPHALTCVMQDKYLFLHHNLYSFVNDEKVKMVHGVATHNQTFIVVQINEFQN